MRPALHAGQGAATQRRLDEGQVRDELLRGEAGIGTEGDLDERPGRSRYAGVSEHDFIRTVREGGRSSMGDASFTRRREELVNRDGAAMGVVEGLATHYCADYERCPYRGQSLGCPGAGTYSPDDPTIVATAWRPDGSRPFPCGAVLHVCGGAGCLVGTVQDACPGCGWTTLDLSEAAFERVCGDLARGVCAVSVYEQD
jgi:hypothetical protein